MALIAYLICNVPWIGLIIFGLAMIQTQRPGAIIGGIAIIVMASLIVIIGAIFGWPKRRR